MKHRILTLLLSATATLLLLAGCNRDPHFISDKAYRDQVHQDFLQRQQLAQGRYHQLFDGMDTLSRCEREALEFLYAYMPYSDLADYDGAFFLQQTRLALATRDTFAWGRDIPEDIFRHFVLVYRVNNENLDTARAVMFKALKERVRGLSLYDAALEVNHWCHEHVAYRASDSRTSAPLATMRTSLGRCGEESTFAVTALRSVGIPARQCYTPRWAHCDDNHAWVEVWVDGQWYFMGACEPDPELNMGWFAVPATRAMMVHSNCFGRYQGDEEVNYSNALYAKINMLPNYAPTKKIVVQVLNADNQPVAGADVMFKLYNYTEYYTLATQHTDTQGLATLTTGLGDLLIWATDGSRYNYSMMDVRRQDTLQLYLTREAGTEYTEDLTVIPPVAGAAKVTPTAAKVEANNRRLAYEDSLRNAYVATFPTQDNYRQYVDANENIATPWPLIQRAEGNYREVARFLNNHTLRLNDIPNYLDDYLRTYSDKDLRDIDAATLDAHLTMTDGSVPYDVYRKGILPARIANEGIRPWRTFLAEQLTTLGITTADQLQQWTLTNIATDDTGNYYGCPLSPRGVFELRHSDTHSRDIFFVAACRSLNIPAYLDNATNIIYVYTDGTWHSIDFNPNPAPQPTAKLVLTYHGTTPAVPTYWTHFSIAKYEEGSFVSFDFENDDRLSHFPATLPLVPGYYVLRTGSRYPNGDVESHLVFFNVNKGQTVTLDIQLPHLAAVNPHHADTKSTVSVDASTELFDGITIADYAGTQGALFVFLGDYREPSKHLVKEIQAIAPQWKAWGGMTYLVAPADAQPLRWKLPNADCFTAAASAPDALRDLFIRQLRLDFNNDYPLVILVDHDGVIRFHSEGYRIGLAEQILKAAQQ